MQPLIHAVLIDDDANHIVKFEEQAKIPSNVRLKTLHAVKAEGEEPFPSIMEYLTNPTNPINLVFCDIRLDESRESDLVGIELIHRLEKHFKGRLPFGIAFITGYESVYSANMLVEMVSPTTLCGFAVKWSMLEPPRSFPDMIDRILQNFQNKFVYRLKGGDGLGESDFAEHYTWYFKGYFDEYLNRSFRVDKVNGQILRLPLRQIIAFERMVGRDAKSVIYYIPEGQNFIEQTEVEYYFEDLCTSLADLDFRPLNTNGVEEGERLSRSMPPNLDHPVVFARVASKFLVNLQYPAWSKMSSIRRADGIIEPIHGQGTWLQTKARLVDGMPLQIHTHRECSWGKEFLEKWFVSLSA